MMSWYACLVSISLVGTTPTEPQVIPTLIDALRDRDVEVRYYAGAALVEMGDAAVDPLIVALQDPDRFQRSGAAYTLGRLAGTARRAKPQLLKALTDEDKDVRRHAAYALSKLLAAERGEIPPPSSLPVPEPVMPADPPR